MASILTASACSAPSGNQDSSIVGNWECRSHHDLEKSVIDVVGRYRYNEDGRAEADVDVTATWHDGFQVLFTSHATSNYQLQNQQLIATFEPTKSTIKQLNGEYTEAELSELRESFLKGMFAGDDTDVFVRFEDDDIMLLSSGGDEPTTCQRH